MFTFHSSKYPSTMSIPFTTLNRSITKSSECLSKDTGKCSQDPTVIECLDHALLTSIMVVIQVAVKLANLVSYQLVLS